MAISAAFKAFTDPESQLRDITREARHDLYAQAWAYYRNRIFSNRYGENWDVYLAQRELYKKTRLIYNPVPQIVDFYVDTIWQPANDPANESLVTPVSQKTDEKLVNAIAQIDQWSNFLSDSPKIKRYAAATGNVLLEGIDDLERQKVYHKAVWPGYVFDLELSSMGDVLAYTVEYDVYDADRKENYRYKKVVTKEKFSYFRDDRAYVPPGHASAVETNPYGFCFAVWIRHTDDGSDFGQPACTNLDKVDEVNSLGSHLHDNIRKTIESPKLIGTDSEILPLIGARRNDETKQLTPSDPRLNWVVFKTGQGASVHDLAGSLKLAEANPYLKDCLASFTDDYPELQSSIIIKDNAQLSGAALERMLGPAQNRLNGVQANYNQQLIKLRQMQIAVAGFRTTNGWQGASTQRDAFKGFGLASYEKGDLDFNLKPSILVQSTESENEDLLTKKAARALSLDTLVDDQEQLRIAGYSDEQVKELLARKSKENELVLDDEGDATPPAE